MKLFLASLAVGVLIPGFLLVILLIVKVLFPGSTAGMFALSFFFWPFFLMQPYSDQSTGTMIALSFVIGTLLDILAITVVAYLIMKSKLSKRARARAAVPPPPPNF
jgi:hypothetical protein